MTVEEILDDYEPDYPMILKYKGECSGENGGQDPLAFDLQKVNEQLRQEFFCKWGKGERRMQPELYRDHDAGNYGLNAVQKDKNKSEKMVQSEQHKMDESFRKLTALIREKELLEGKLKEKLKKTTLADVFQDYSKTDLVEIAKNKRLKNAASCKKAELIQRLTDHMLQPEVIEAYFLCMQDDEIAVLEKAVKKPGAYTEEDGVLLSGLYEAAYVGMLGTDDFVVPAEVALQYQALCGKVFTQKRKKRSYLLACLKAAGLLYGIAPVEIILKMVQTNPEIRMTQEELCEEIERIPDDISPMVLVRGSVYRCELYPDDRGLLNAQGDKEFYIPTKQEILDLSNLGHFPENSQLKRLKFFMITKLGVSEEEAGFVSILIQNRICNDCKMQEVSDVLETFGIQAANRKQAEELIKLLNDLWNNTRMLVNRGFTPNEMAARRGIGENTAAAAPKEQPAKIVSFQNAKKAKIYPNDPCPCGSGKKYKNCCRNKE